MGWPRRYGGMRGMPPPGAGDVLAHCDIDRSMTARIRRRGSGRFCLRIGPWRSSEGEEEVACVPSMDDAVAAMRDICKGDIVRHAGVG